MSNGLFPIALKVGQAIVIPKSDNRRCRLIHVQPFTGKLFERIILDMIIDKRSDGFGHQFAYLNNKSINDVIAHMVIGVYNAWAGANRQAILRMDVESAFDRIPHDVVLEGVKKLTSTPFILHNFILS